MGVRIRLARLGRRNAPFYRVFVADSRAPRDGRHLEVVGHFDPVPARDGTKHVGLNFDRLRYWLGVGAQPTEPVSRLLGAQHTQPYTRRRSTRARAHAAMCERPLAALRASGAAAAGAADAATTAHAASA